VTAYVPTLPAGTTAPLVLFLPGFQLNTDQYAGTLERLASHGFVVVGANPAGSLLSVNHVNMAADGRAVITWATSEAPFASSVDATRIGVSGHSLGGKLSTLITMDDDRIDALYAIDPVDGDPSPFGGGGSRDRPDLVPARGSEITVPAGFAGETTNGMSGGGFGSMACAPSEQNFQQFYAAATAAPWAAQWDITGADHMDFLDDPACGFACDVCPDGPADDATVLATNRTLFTAFFLRHLAGDAAMEAYLTGASVPAGVTTMRRP
jgi:predicted dienelactone hydrolase